MTITDKVTTPLIVSENLSDTAKWQMAMTATAGFEKNSAVIFRAVGFLASVVILTETTQKEIIDTTGVNASNLSRAKNALIWKASEIAGDDVITCEHVSDALEMLISLYGSINEADLARKGQDGESNKKEMTLADAVANLYKWADKNGISREMVVSEVMHQVGE